MKELRPFTTLAPIKKALDNGGRFYDFFEKANNEEITRAELAKAAGVFSAGIQAFMYLWMAKQDLKESDQEAVLSLLQPTLRRDFQKKQPPLVKPSEIETNHKAGQSIVAAGYLKQIEDRTQFTGMIMIPIMAGKVMTMIPVPIFERFKVYEFFDKKNLVGPSAIVCTDRHKKLDVACQYQFGGVLKKVQYRSKEPKRHTVYLEPIYFVKR